MHSIKDVNKMKFCKGSGLISDIHGKRIGGCKKKVLLSLCRALWRILRAKMYFSPLK